LTYNIQAGPRLTHKERKRRDKHPHTLKQLITCRFWLLTSRYCYITTWSTQHACLVWKVPYASWKYSCYLTIFLCNLRNSLLRNCHCDC